MADYLGFCKGAYGGIALKGFTNPKIHLFIDTKKAVSNEVQYEADTLAIIVKGVIHVAPSNKSTVLTPIEFSWGAVFNVYEYQLEIANDPDFNDVVRSVMTSFNTVSVDNLADGTYYWRVRYR